MYVACPVHFLPLPQMKRSTINKDYEAKQASNGMDQALSVDPPAPPTLGGAPSQSVDWPGAAAGGDAYARLEEVGELRQAIALKVRLAKHVLWNGTAGDDGEGKKQCTDC